MAASKADAENEDLRRRLASASAEVRPKHAPIETTAMRLDERARSSSSAPRMDRLPIENAKRAISRPLVSKGSSKSNKMPNQSRNCSAGGVDCGRR